MSKLIPHVVIVGVSMGLFSVSLLEDGYYIDRESNPNAYANCFGLLLLGWIGMMDGVFAWLANPALLAAWLFIWTKELRYVSLASSAFALCLSLSFLLHTSILTDEGGGHSAITGYGSGYWLWVCSTGVMVLGNLAILAAEQQVSEAVASTASLRE